MQRIKVGERERWERRQLPRRAGADLIGVGDEARVGGGTGDDRDAQDRPSSRRDRRGDQRLAVADVAHQSRAASAAIRAAFTGELPGVHGFALARGAGDLESPVGRATEAAAALERVAAGEDSSPSAREREPPDGTPGAVAQHPAGDLPMADVVGIRPCRPLSGERRIEQRPSGDARSSPTAVDAMAAAHGSVARTDMRIRVRRRDCIENLPAPGVASKKSAARLRRRCPQVVRESPEML